MSMIPPTTLRPYTHADRARVLDHLELTGAATYSDDFARATNDYVRSGDDPAEQLGGPGARMIVAEAGGDITGSIVYIPGVADDDASMIASLYVSPDRQRQGLGQRLLQAAFADMPAERNVVLYAMQASTKAIQFYDKNGFKSFEIRDFELYGVVYPSVGMIFFAPLPGRA
jgi:ribosomal protein S18 acetylase RimI-like enzyme